jgi:hypothetical protein
MAGTTALIAGAAAPWPTGAVAAPASPGRQNADPRPIPGGTDLFHLLGLPPGPTFHFYFPAFRQEVSTITDFNGFVAAAEIQGTGTATDTSSHTTTTLTYDADMRFMDGVYVGVDGHTYKGTFGFI